MFRQSKVRFQREDDSIDICLFPLENPEELDRSRPSHQERLDLFIDGDVDIASGLVNWAASGMIVILDTADGYFVPIGYRDAGAPTHPEKLGTPSGIAETIEELIYPRLMGYREALEEILVFDTTTNSWIRPVLYDETDLYQTVIEQEDYPSDIYSLWDSKKNRETTITSVEAQLYTIAEDSWTVSHPSKNITTEFSGKSILDKETLNLDLLDVMVVDMSSYSIDELAFYDGEEFDGDLLDRLIYVFSLSEFVSLFDGSVTATEFQSGRVTSEVTREFDGVPVLRKSHQDICSWCEEELE